MDFKDLKGKKALQYKWASAIPIICAIIYFVLGFILKEKGVSNAYVISLIVFIVVPFNYVIVGLKKFTIGYPVLVTLIYFALCTILEISIGKGYWHPIWVIFLTIPIYYIFFGTKKIGEKIKDHTDFVDFDADED